MRITNLMVPAILIAGALVIAGCEVDKTKDGDLTLPQYDVSKTRDGNVTVPTYEVTTPDVTVQEKKVQVDVPTISTEKRTITVPDIDVTTPSEKRAN